MRHQKVELLNLFLNKRVAQLADSGSGVEYYYFIVFGSEFNTGGVATILEISLA